MLARSIGIRVNWRRIHRRTLLGLLGDLLRLVCQGRWGGRRCCCCRRAGASPDRNGLDGAAAGTELGLFFFKCWGCQRRRHEQQRSEKKEGQHFGLKRCEPLQSLKEGSKGGGVFVRTANLIQGISRFDGEPGKHPASKEEVEKKEGKGL